MPRRPGPVDDRVDDPIDDRVDEDPLDEDLGPLDDLVADVDDPLEEDEDEPLDGDLRDLPDAADEPPPDLGEVDEGGTELPDLDAPEEDEAHSLDLREEDEAGDALGGLPVIPWAGVAHLAALGLDMPCVADPTSPRTVLTLPDAPDTPRLELEIAFAGWRVVGLVTVERGAAASLRLGRDLLGGRALVRP